MDDVVISIFCFIIGIVLGILIVIIPDSTVVVSGNSEQGFYVNYDKTIYRLVKLQRDDKGD